MNRQQTRLTILGGFLGSGKTTILNTLLSNLDPHKRTAVIINDFGEVNIDSRIIDPGKYSKKEITGGCICCSLKEKLLDSLLIIRKEEVPDEILIEATGLAVPWEMKETIEKRFPEGQILVDQVLVCVDAIQFDRFNGPLPVYRRQFEGFPHILMTKGDLHPQERIQHVSECIKKQYPRISSLGYSENGQIDRTSLPEMTKTAAAALIPGLLGNGRSHSDKSSIVQLSFSGNLRSNIFEMKQAIQIHHSKVLRLKGLITAKDGSDHFIHFDGKIFSGFNYGSKGPFSRLTLFCLEESRVELETVFKDFFE